MKGERVPEHCKTAECEWWKGSSACLCECQGCGASVDEAEQEERLADGEEGCPKCNRVLHRSVEGKFSEAVYVRIWCEKCDYQRTER